jgi:hypothetical protein
MNRSAHLENAHPGEKHKCSESGHLGTEQTRPGHVIEAISSRSLDHHLW